jgi:hypothetical protein
MDNVDIKSSSISSNSSVNNDSISLEDKHSQHHFPNIASKVCFYAARVFEKTANIPTLVTFPVILLIKTGEDHGMYGRNVKYYPNLLCMPVTGPLALTAKGCYSLSGAPRNKSVIHMVNGYCVKLDARKDARHSRTETSVSMNDLSLVNESSPSMKAEVEAEKIKIPRIQTNNQGHSNSHKHSLHIGTSVENIPNEVELSARTLDGFSSGKAEANIRFWEEDKLDIASGKLDSESKPYTHIMTSIIYDLRQIFDKVYADINFDNSDKNVRKSSSLSNILCTQTSNANLSKAINVSQKIGFKIQRNILECSSIQEARRMIYFWIAVAYYCCRKHNYQAGHIIFGILGTASVCRLVKELMDFTDSIEVDKQAIEQLEVSKTTLSQLNKLKNIASYAVLCVHLAENLPFILFLLSHAMLAF